MRATDALTVEKGPRKIEILWRPIVRGPTCPTRRTSVKDTSAAAVRAMLPALRPWKPYGLTSTVVPRANPGENTTTFLLVSKHSGCTVIIR